MKTALYMRVSTLEQAQEGYSLLSQKRKLIEFCNYQKWDIYNIYCDEGISGATISERPAMVKLIEDLKNKLFDSLIVAKLDRLSRSTKDLLTILELTNKYDIRLVSVEEQIDFSTPNGKMQASIFGIFAEFENS